MTGSLAVLGLAVVGAGLFLAAGCSLGRAVTPAPVVPRPPVPIDPSPQVLAAAEEARLRAELLERVRDQLQGELVAERTARQQLGLRLEASSTDLADARAAKGALEAQLAALDQQHAELVARHATRDRELIEAQRKLAAKPVGFSELELARTHEALERACEEIVALRLEKQRGERAELARLALERELQQMRATQVAASASSRPLRTVAVAEPNLTTTHLNALVDRVRVEGEYVAVAVADAQGLAAAGVGEHVDELAAFSALLMGLNGQATRYFPMHEFGHATLTDAQGVTVEARPVPGPHGLVLLTLGATQETR